MAATLSRPPEAAIKAATSTMEELGASPPSAPVVQLFGGGLAPLAKGAGLKALRPTGWRWLIPDDKRWTAIDVFLDSKDKALGHPVQQKGQIVDRLASLLEDPQAFGEPRGRKYQFRVIEIPALHFAFLWYAGLQGGRDLFIALNPFASRGSQKPIPPASFTRLLTSAAKHQQALDAEMLRTEIPARVVNLRINVSAAKTHAAKPTASKPATAKSTARKRTNAAKARTSRSRQTATKTGAKRGRPVGSRTRRTASSDPAEELTRRAQALIKENALLKEQVKDLEKGLKRVENALGSKVTKARPAEKRRAKSVRRIERTAISDVTF